MPTIPITIEIELSDEDAERFEFDSFRQAKSGDYYFDYAAFRLEEHFPQYRGPWALRQWLEKGPASNVCYPIFRERPRWQPPAELNIPDGAWVFLWSPGLWHASLNEPKNHCGGSQYYEAAVSWSITNHAAALGIKFDPPPSKKYQVKK